MGHLSRESCHFNDSRPFAFYLPVTWKDTVQVFNWYIYEKYFLVTNCVYLYFVFIDLDSNMLGWQHTDNTLGSCGSRVVHRVSAQRQLKLQQVRYQNSALSICWDHEQGYGFRAECSVAFRSARTFAEPLTEANTLALLTTGLHMSSKRLDAWAHDLPDNAFLLILQYLGWERASSVAVRQVCMMFSCAVQ